MSRYGLRYVVIGLGSPDEPATDEDVEAAADMVSERTGFTAVHLSEATSDALTAAMLARGEPS